MNVSKEYIGDYRFRHRLNSEQFDNFIESLRSKFNDYATLMLSYGETERSWHVYRLYGLKQG